MRNLSDMELDMVSGGQGDELVLPPYGDPPYATPGTPQPGTDPGGHRNAN
ncbi:hypothetical protein [Lysobacter sp. HA18]